MMLVWLLPVNCAWVWLGKVSASRAKQARVIWPMVLWTFVFITRQCEIGRRNLSANWGNRESRLNGAVEGLAGRRGRFVVFDEAGGGGGIRGEVGPRASHA